MNILASDYNISDGESIGRELNNIFAILKGKTGESTIELEAGATYYIDSEDVPKREVYITNTIAEREWRKGEERQVKRIAMDINDLHNVTIVGNGAKIIMRGEMTNIVITDSDNIKIQDLTIDVERPNLHELKVIGTGAHYVDFAIDRESNYTKKGSKIIFTGKDYEYNLCDSFRWSWWTSLIKVDTPNNIVRTAHPMQTSIHIRELEHDKLRSYTITKPKTKVGDRYYIFDVRRKNVGIFIDRSSDVVLDNVEQNFNYSLGIVAQDSENITINKVKMRPNIHSDMHLCSTADFVHICMCRGKVEVKDCVFDGASDDCLNVHGIHFQVKSISGNKIVVRFMHGQAYGFNPLRVGDSIDFIDRTTLLPKGTSKILDSKMVDKYNIELTLDDVSAADVACVIEDTSACPELLFEGNTMTRIITRGILVTTRKAVIRGNDFGSCSMHSILFSDDANNWYESGRVEDVLIENNHFGYTPMYNIYIKPENTAYAGSVHGDFVIRGNKFESYPNGGIYARSTRSITMSNNEVIGGKLPIDVDKVEEFKED